MSYKLAYTTVPADLNTSYNSLGCILYGGDTPASPIILNNVVLTYITTGLPSGISGNIYTSVTPGNYLVTVTGTGEVSGTLPSNSKLIISITTSSGRVFSQIYYPNNYGLVSFNYTFPITISVTENLKCIVLFQDTTYSTNSISLMPGYDSVSGESLYYCSLTRIG
jgi:hypothetical protein